MVVLSELALRQVQDLGTPEDWACIARSLGLGDLRPEERDALWRRLGSIFRVWFKPDAFPDLRPANYVHALDRLKQDAERLRADMWPPENEYDAEIAKIYAVARSSGELDEERLDVLEERLDALRKAKIENWPPTPFPDFNDNEAMYIVIEDLLGEAKHRELQALLNQLVADADAARRHLGDDMGGRRSDRHLEHAIRDLAWVYYDHTRKKPGVSRNLRGSPGGPFLRFVKAVFQVFAPGRLKGDEALVKLIRKASKQKWPRDNQGN
jgi:hypothetical protein